MLPGGRPNSPFGPPELALRDDDAVLIVYYPGFEGPNGLAPTAGRIDLTALGSVPLSSTWYDAATGRELILPYPEITGGGVRTLPLPTEFGSPSLGPDTDLLLILRRL